MQNLTDCELLIMKCIWSAGRGLTVAEVREILKEEYGKTYERPTVCTFIGKLEKKGYVLGERWKGRGYMYNPLIKEENYRSQKQKEFMDFWYEGSPTVMISSLYEDKLLSEDDIKKLRELFHGWES